MPYEIFLGLRYLATRKRRRKIALNAWMSIGGVAVGVAALIATLAVMTGFSEEIRDKILGTHAHIIIADFSGESLQEDANILEQIRRTPGIAAAAPFIRKQALVSAREEALGVFLLGIDPKEEAQATQISQRMVAGTLGALTPAPVGSKERPGMIIGQEISARLGLFVGDEIHLIAPVEPGGAQGTVDVRSALSVTPKIRKFRVAGIFNAGMLEYDASLVYIALSEAQDFFNMTDRINGIQIKANDLFVTAPLTKRLTAQLPLPYEARDWRDLNHNLFSALKLEKTMMSIILVLIVLVASFNMTSMLMMTVSEKTRDIAILKTMGATRKSIMHIFMWEGIAIGVLGVAMGLPLGLSICALLQRFYTLPVGVYYIENLPMRVIPSDVIFVISAAILIGWFATIYPSQRAAQIDPAEALRYE